MWSLVRTPGSSRDLGWILAHDEVKGRLTVAPLGEEQTATGYEMVRISEVFCRNVGRMNEFKLGGPHLPNW